MKLIPLAEFICDTCGEKINSPSEGYVEFVTAYQSDGKTSDFNIIHSKKYSPLQNNGKAKCHQHDDAAGRGDLPLSNFFGPDNLNRIYSFLDVGEIIAPTYEGPRVRDIREYIEFIRRITVPYYEEARQYLDEAENDGWFDGANEVSVYTQQNLEKIIEKYRK